MLFEILSSIKEIISDYVRHRLFPVTCVILVMFFTLIHRLFVLQIVEGESHEDSFTYRAEKTLTIDSVRGNIRDCNGQLLAYNDLSYSVIFSNTPELAELAEKKGVPENVLKNEVLADAIKILEKNGDKLYVDFPIELKKNGTYSFRVSDAKRRSFLRDVYTVLDFEELPDEKKNATAEQVFEYLCGEDMFEISDSYDPKVRLMICACRYKLWMNRYQQYMPVTIAYDISDVSNAALTEHEDDLPGVTVSVKSLRRYNDAKYFSHIIGYIGPISDEELKEYNAKLPEDEAYSGEEMVGKTGIEQYCEADLRGTVGSETMYVDNLGKVIEKVSQKPATAGDDVYLTIDADLQKYCYDMLEQEITSIILANLSPGNVSANEENAKIPITDVYFGLLNNDIIRMDRMGDEEATGHEKAIYAAFNSRRQTVVNTIDDIMRVKHTPLRDLDEYNQDYMEYICEILVKNNIMDNSKIDQQSPEFTAYVNNQTSLYDYLMYAISVEAIDISAFSAKSDYYDNEEIYGLLCDYVDNYLLTDEDFEKLVLKVMVVSGEITGADIVNLLYEQGVLDAKTDPDYTAYQNGEFGPYEFMRTKLSKLEINPGMLALKPCSGSVVVTDVRTGDVKAMVSYPGYDNNRLTNEIEDEYYDQLLHDKATPMLNRATQVQTAPGSTYKIVSSIAGMEEHIIDDETYYSCLGEFDKIEPSAYCWNTYGHGGLDCASAIMYSCNVFFYNVGYDMSITKDGYYNDQYGLERLAKYAKMFGLGDPSGVEVPEVSPRISDSDAVRSAIGQGHNLYAPIQLSRYVTTVANKGTCYNLTLIDKVTDYEGNLVRDNSATVLDKMDTVSPKSWSVVHDGMRRVIAVNTPDYNMCNRVNVAIAGKTGTAQESKVEPNHATFISFAPYEHPEVSVTTVIQYGYSSGNPQELAGFVYAYMYDKDALIGAEMLGNTQVSD